MESADPVKRNLVLSEPQVAAEKAARRQEAKERAAMWCAPPPPPGAPAAALGCAGSPVPGVRWMDCFSLQGISGQRLPQVPYFEGASLQA